MPWRTLQHSSNGGLIRSTELSATTIPVAFGMSAEHSVSRTCFGKTPPITNVLLCVFFLQVIRTSIFICRLEYVCGKILQFLSHQVVQQLLQQNFLTTQSLVLNDNVLLLQLASFYLLHPLD